MSTNHSNNKKSVLYIAIMLAVVLALFLVFRYRLPPAEQVKTSAIVSETTTTQVAVVTSQSTTPLTTSQSKTDNATETSQVNAEMTSSSEMVQSTALTPTQETSMATVATTAQETSMATVATTVQETSTATVATTVQETTTAIATTEAAQEVTTTAVNQDSAVPLSKNLPEFNLSDSVDSVTQALTEKGLAFQVITNYLSMPQSGVTAISETETEILIYQDKPLDYSRIYQLQEQLKIAGYYVVIDGAYGAKTKAQMDAFCQAQLGTTYPNYNSIIENALLTFNSDKMAGDIDDYLVYASKSKNLRSTDVPSRLVPIGVPHVDKVKQIEAATNQQLIKMFGDAEKAGVSLYVVSGYRSFDYQIGLFERYRRGHGFAAANRFSALPGQSEHQTGLTVDLADPTVSLSLSQSFENTAAFKWLDAHAHEYGFILSYPKGKEAITGYVYEPWHYRFVGSAEVATDIKQRGLTLEEYHKEKN